ncbi:hypothetical protein KSP40_PGU002717 [Platanthera guangdongensis]|uniref:Uncharacterized protein n=1 Tax=Platanthera guangdongensis TaxID=2320717 RepID=A0ABR2M4G7_9ASPA
MIGYTNISFILLVAFSFSFLCLTATLLYFLCRIRRQRQLSRHGDAELGGNVPSFKTPSLHFLCCRIQSRIEPTGDLPGLPVLCSSRAEQVKTTPPAAAYDEECVLVRWRAEAFGASRVLYTIREEEREGVESDGERADGSGGSDGHREEETVEEEDVSFSTPCPSPAFYTPASSPTRSPDKVPTFA